MANEDLEAKGSAQHFEKESIRNNSPPLGRSLSGDGNEPAIVWQTWVVVAAASLNYTAYALILTSSGFWAGSIVGSVGGASIRLWIAQAWIPVSAILAPPLARMGDNVGRRWVWLVTLLCGVLGNFLIAGGKNIGMIIVGICFWGICFGNAGNLIAIPAEVLPRRHRGTAAMALQIGGYFGTTIALLGGAGIIINVSPQTGSGWRAIFWLTGGVHALVFLLVFIFYHPAPVLNPTGASYLSRLFNFDIIGTALFAASLLPLLMGLIWGGATYAWNSAPVISTLVIGFFFMGVLAIHQIWIKKDGLFHHGAFKNRNVVLCIFAIGVEGFAYIVFNGFLGQETAVLFDASPYGLGLRFCAFIWSAAVGSVICGIIAYRYRCLNELLIGGFALFLVGVIGLATVKPGSGKAIIGWTVISGFGTAAPISFLFAVVQLSAEPEFTGIVSGLMIAGRNFGGSVGPAVCNAVFTSKITSSLPSYIARAALSAGLSSPSVPAFTAAIAGGNTTLALLDPAVTPAILFAGGQAALEAYAYSFRFIWIVVLPFILLSLIACILMHNVRHEMDHVIDRPLEAQTHEIRAHK